MADKPKAKRKGGRPPKFDGDPDRIAAVLILATKDGDEKAAKTFSCSVRWIQGVRAQVEAGKLPEVARSCDKQKAILRERCSDLLVETYEKALRKQQAALEEPQKLRDVTGAVKILGELLVTRKALDPDADDDEQQPGSDRPGRTPEEAEEAESGTSAGSARQARRSEDADPIH
jgi:hypothetical protein